MIKILITGGNGYVAKSLYNAFKDVYDVTSISRKDFDLTAFQSMNKFFQDKYYDVVIHCAVSGGSRLKPDTTADMDINLAMYYNLLQHKPHYGKLIHLGSGAEYYNPESPYGLSKRIIAKSILSQDRFYNIRIFGVFDENELDTRFIKANIKRYINKEPMLIQNKKMTFFYMKDLIILIKYYIQTADSKLLKEANCSYINSVSLHDIANMINELSDYKVPIYMDTATVTDYESKLNAPYGLPIIGLANGIQETYTKLLK
jgi:nucleoside-diphosphate-sugar epimerase